MLTPSEGDGAHGKAPETEAEMLCCDHVGHLREDLFASLQPLIQLGAMLRYVTQHTTITQPLWIRRFRQGISFTVHEKSDLLPKIKKKKPFEDRAPTPPPYFGIWCSRAPPPSKTPGTGGDSGHAPE